MYLLLTTKLVLNCPKTGIKLNAVKFNIATILLFCNRKELLITIRLLATFLCFLKRKALFHFLYELGTFDLKCVNI